MIKKIWYSELLISEDKKILNKCLRQLYDNLCEIKKKHETDTSKIRIHDISFNLYGLSPNKTFKKDIPNIYLEDILKQYSHFLNFEKTENAYYVYLSYYGEKFIKEGGYCWGYYIKQIITFKFLKRSIINKIA